MRIKPTEKCRNEGFEDDCFACRKIEQEKLAVVNFKVNEGSRNSISSRAINRFVNETS